MRSACRLYGFLLGMGCFVSSVYGTYQEDVVATPVASYAYPYHRYYRGYQPYMLRDLPVSLVREWMNRRPPDLFAVDDKGLLPLNYASLNPDAAVLRMVVLAGADVHEENAHGVLPLGFAAQFAEGLDTIRVLLGSGADPSLLDAQGLSALHLAAEHNPRANILLALLDTGADPNARSRLDGWTPLHTAARGQSNPLVLQSLIQAGAKLSATNADNRTALHIASAYNTNTRILLSLLQAGAATHARDKNHMGPLDLAVAYNPSVQVTRLLLKNGFHDDLRKASAQTKMTPLHYAARYSSSVDVVAALVENGAPLEAKDIYDRTPLYYAQQNSTDAKDEIIEYLVAQGARIWFLQPQMKW